MDDAGELYAAHEAVIEAADAKRFAGVSSAMPAGVDVDHERDLAQDLTDVDPYELVRERGQAERR